MRQLLDNELEQVSGGKFTNTVYNDSMKPQLGTDLGEAEKNIDKNIMFSRLNDNERQQGMINKQNANIIRC